MYFYAKLNEYYLCRENAYIQGHILTWLRKYIHGYIYTYIYTWLHTWLHKCMVIYMVTLVNTLLHMYIHGYIHAYMLHTWLHSSIHGLQQQQAEQGIADIPFPISSLSVLSRHPKVPPRQMRYIICLQILGISMYVLPSLSFSFLLSSLCNVVVLCIASIIAAVT